MDTYVSDADIQLNVLLCIESIAGDIKCRESLLKTEETLMPRILRAMDKHRMCKPVQNEGLHALITMYFLSKVIYADGRPSTNNRWNADAHYRLLKAGKCSQEARMLCVCALCVCVIA